MLAEEAAMLIGLETTMSMTRARTPTAALRPLRRPSVPLAAMPLGSKSPGPVMTKALDDETMKALKAATSHVSCNKALALQIPYAVCDNRMWSESFGALTELGQAVDTALRADSVFGPLLDGRVVQNVSVIEHGMEQVRTPPVRVRQCELT